MSNHSPYIRSSLDETSPCLHRLLATRYTISPANCGNKWTIKSPPLAISISRLKGDDCSRHQLCCDYDFENQEVISTQMWHRFKHYKSSSLTQNQGTHAHTRKNILFLAPKRGQHLKLTFIIWFELRKVYPDIFCNKEGRSIAPSWLDINNYDMNNMPNYKSFILD